MIWYNVREKLCKTTPGGVHKDVHSCDLPQDPQLHLRALTGKRLPMALRSRVETETPDSRGRGTRAWDDGTRRRKHRTSLPVCP